MGADELGRDALKVSVRKGRASRTYFKTEGKPGMYSANVNYGGGRHSFAERGGLAFGELGGKKKGRCKNARRIGKKQPTKEREGSGFARKSSQKGHLGFGKKKWTVEGQGSKGESGRKIGNQDWETSKPGRRGKR